MAFFNHPGPRYNRNVRLTNNRQQSRFSEGSFYEMIPNMFEPVQKPSRDEILKQLRESTKSDKMTGWRMKEKYGSREFDGLHASPNGGKARLRLESSMDKTYDRWADDNTRVPPTYWSDLYTHPDVDKTRANFLREQCIRKGDVYGPEAIAAVSGYGAQKNAKAPWDFKGDYYDDDYDTKEVMVWARNFYTMKAASRPSSANFPRRSQDAKLSSSIAGSSHSSGTGPHHNDEGDDKNEVGCAEAAEKEHFRTPKSFQSRSKRSMRIEPVNFAGRVNVEIKPFVGAGGDTKKSKLNQMSKSKKREWNKIYGKVKKPLRRKRVPKKSMPQQPPQLKQLDTRHKGPKIQGFFSETAIGEQINSQPEERKIRTVVLPYPKAKYKNNVLRDP